VYADGRVHVGSIAVDAQTGTVLWNTDLGAALTPQAQVAKGVVYLGCAEQKLCQLDAVTGRPIRTTIGPKAWLSGVAGDVYYAWGEDSSRFTLFAASIATGQTLWQVSGAGSRPVVVNGTLYARVGQAFTAYRIAPA
jgi:outer membrane protein assembly factor BamB